LKNREHGAMSEELSKTVFIRFFFTLLAAVGAIILIYIVTEILLSQFIWQPHDNLYRLFKLIERNAATILTMCGLITFVVIFGIYWRRTLGYIDTIVEASEMLIAPGSELIRLPVELKQVEDRMNEARQNVARNARLAREAEQRKNDLVMYLAHDIKTPLTSVIGYLSLLSEAPDMPLDQKAKYLNITLEKANRLEKLMDEFFEITRYNFQAGTLSVENIDLYYMLAQMTDEFYPLLAAKGKQAFLHVPEDMTIYGDPDKLARVFNNVLKNAVAYSPDNSVIDITAAISGDMATIVFSNAGSIPKEKLASIFDKFYRLDSGRSSDKGGAGLGLAIAKEIVISHGGCIYADSDGKQTSFTVELPVMPEQALENVKVISTFS